MNPIRLLSKLMIGAKQREYNQQVSEMLVDSNGVLSLESITTELLQYVINNSFLLSPDTTINIGNTLYQNVNELYRSRFAEIRRLMPGALVTIYDSLHEHFPNINDNEEASILESRLAPIVRQIVQEGEVVSHPEQ